MVEEGMSAEGTDDEGEPEAAELPQSAVVASIKQRQDSAEAMQEEGTDDEGSDDLQVSAYCISNLSLTNSLLTLLGTVRSCATGANGGRL